MTLAGSTDQSPTLVHFLRSVRIFRLLKLTKYVKKGSVIYDIIYMAVPFLINMLILMSIFITVYAVIGMSLFPYIKFRAGINTHANFSKFSLAFVALLRVCTGEGWNVLLDDCLRTLRPNDVCLEINSFEDFERGGGIFVGCGTNSAYFYFISFLIIFSYVIMNLFTGIVIESFYLRARLSNSKVSVNHINSFSKKWKEYDTDNCGFLHWKTAKALLNELKPPLGIHPEFKNVPGVLNLYFQSLKLPLYRNQDEKMVYVHMYDMILALMKSYIQSDDVYGE